MSRRAVSNTLISSTLIVGGPLSRFPLSRLRGFAFLAFACCVTGLDGCSILAPSNNIMPPPPALAVHPVRADSVGYLTAREKTVTIVLPDGMPSLADTTADVRAVAGDTVVWSCVVTGPV